VKLFFLGIGGTLMGNLALLAKAAGHDVTGCDGAIYPPMSTVLADAGIDALEGFDKAMLSPRPDLVILGNAGLPRGHAGVEAVLSAGVPFMSGAQWLGETLLRERHVLAVAGTHGKTTTTAMLTWILTCAGLEPGYLIGGVARDLPRAAELGGGQYFVVEADEYDCSFFDRRSKFVHYHPRTLIVNNLEYDHADIFPDLRSIQDQFHLLLRTVPAEGQILYPAGVDAIDEVLERGCWSTTVPLQSQEHGGREEGDAPWTLAFGPRKGDVPRVFKGKEDLGALELTLSGRHNAQNALAALAAAHHVGVAPQVALDALKRFKGVKRRLEVLYEDATVVVYDDFAHHPTAIRSTLQGLRERVGGEEIIALIEPRSHTMSLGALRPALAHCTAPADAAHWLSTPRITWDLTSLSQDSITPTTVHQKAEGLLEAAFRRPPNGPSPRRHLVCMSNGDFQNLPQRLAQRCAELSATTG
jgi:UDP-N-acetylmuramate: L-alanyl-gamma-D-glutamyl-meso-diaminopimelate ligase